MTRASCCFLDMQRRWFLSSGECVALCPWPWKESEIISNRSLGCVALAVAALYTGFSASLMQHCLTIKFGNHYHQHCCQMKVYSAAKALKTACIFEIENVRFVLLNNPHFSSREIESRPFTRAQDTHSSAISWSSSAQKSSIEFEDRWPSSYLLCSAFETNSKFVSFSLQLKDFTCFLITRCWSHEFASRSTGVLKKCILFDK